MSARKTFRRGEQIVKEGEKPTSIYLIQSGLVSIFLSKQKKNIELYKATAGQILGEEALLGLPAGASAQAINEAVVTELPADGVQRLVEAANPVLKGLLKSVLDKQKAFTGELKSLKADQDTTACPPDNVAKVFACLFHIAKYYGQTKDGKTVIGWPALKRGSQRLFLESPIRLEQAFNILVKLKLAEVKMVKPEGAEKDDPEEMGPCTFHDLGPVERFFEFYQNYYFKGNSASILKFDEKSRQTVDALLKVSENEKMDRNSVVYMNYRDTCDKLKAQLGAAFNPDQILRLEQKGLFVKRQSDDRGGTLSFIRSEFNGALEAWKFLREVEKWNENGFVDLKEKETPPPGAAAPGAVDPDAPILTCPVCISQVSDAAKFCSACGTKLGQAA